MNRLLTGLLGVIGLTAVSAWPAQPVRDPTTPPRPTVYLTRDDIRLAKTNLTRFEWARQTADTIQRDADAWLAKPDDWFVRNVPAAGACFAYGFTGCPICGANWGT